LEAAIEASSSAVRMAQLQADLLARESTIQRKNQRVVEFEREVHLRRRRTRTCNNTISQLTLEIYRLELEIAKQQREITVWVETVTAWSVRVPDSDVSDSDVR